MTENQNPEQKARDNIDALLQQAGWVVQSAKKIDLSAGLGQAVREYTLSPDLYRLLGEKAEYTRQAGFGRLQQEQMVKNYVTQHGRITRQEVIELCRLTPNQAYKLLISLCNNGFLKKQGLKKGSSYINA